MILNWRRPFLFIFPILFLFAACGDKDSTTGEISYNESLPPPGASKDIGLRCLSEGDLSCAKENYCAFRGDAQAGLRCCLASFLEFYFSENTQALGVMLGYDPARFGEIRGKTRDELLKDKALPFGELFLLPHEKSPPVKDLLRQWGVKLVSDQASTSELMDRIGRFGSDLEGTVACLDSTLGSLGNDEVEKEIFQTDAPLAIGPRDLNFVRFLLGAISYSTQAVAPYDLGAAHFPAWPPSDDFLKDVNGLAGEGDARFGDLSEGKAAKIAALHPRLVQAFEALRRFSDLKGSPAKVDSYLNWRFSQEFQEKASGYLKAAYLSLNTGDWQSLPGDRYQIRLSVLGQAGSVPDSRGLADDLPFLLRDEAGDVDVNGEFFERWAAPIVRIHPENPSQ